MGLPDPPRKRTVTWIAITVLLLASLVGMLWVPFYARATPKLGDFPFFYWYQLIWVPLTAAILWICYLLLRIRPTQAAGPGTAGTGGSARTDQGSGEEK